MQKCVMKVMKHVHGNYNEVITVVLNSPYWTEALINRIHQLSELPQRETKYSSRILMSKPIVEYQPACTFHCGLDGCTLENVITLPDVLSKIVRKCRNDHKISPLGWFGSIRSLSFAYLKFENCISKFCLQIWTCNWLAKIIWQKLEKCISDAEKKQICKCKKIEIPWKKLIANKKAFILTCVKIGFAMWNLKQAYKWCVYSDYWGKYTRWCDRWQLRFSMQMKTLWELRCVILWVVYGSCCSLWRLPYRFYKGMGLIVAESRKTGQKTGETVSFLKSDA